MNHRRLLAAAALASAATLAGASVAPANPTQGPLGAHVAECAHVALGQRADPPGVSCVHDGHVHSFATFGELVAHLREHHG